MDIRITCPNCKQEYFIDESQLQLGQKAECENCHRSFTISMDVLDCSSEQFTHDTQNTTQINTSREDIKTKLSEGKEGENWSDNKLGTLQKSNVEKSNQKSNQVNENDLTNSKAINEAIDIWSRVSKIAEILYLVSLPISPVSVMIILMSCSNDTCRFGIPVIIIFLVIQLFLVRLFCLSAQAVLEVLRALNNNIQAIAKSVTLATNTQNKQSS